MQTETLFTGSTTIYTSTWMPIGKSNLEAMNRFIGSHKRYATPTEFGIAGQIEDLQKGAFTMKKHGVFLTPHKYNSTNFLHANVKESINDKQSYGLSAYKSGLVSLGINVKNQMNTPDIKTITGQLGYKITDNVFPILNDVQKSLIYNILQRADDSNIHYKLPIYSLIKCSETLGISGKNSAEIFERHASKIESLTDWVIELTSLNNCHLFIGNSATLCIGSPCQLTEKILLHLQFVQSCSMVSKKLHTMLWSLRKKIHKLRESSKIGNYKILKTNNTLICEYNSTLLKVKTFDQLLRNETQDMRNTWQEIDENENTIDEYLRKTYFDEVEKSENRLVTIEQLSEDLEVLSTQLESRLELIMTRDSMTLNIILLALTIISLLGVGEIAGFTSRQWKIVVLFLLPFSVISVIYLRNFLKNFIRRP